MSVSSATAHEVRPSNGSSTFGGGFTRTASGIDYSQANAAHVVFDGSTILAVTAGASATITITGYTVSANDVGNRLNLASGTNFTAGIYEIISVNTGANTWTLDRTCSTGVGAAMVGKMGGAFAAISTMNTNMANGHQGWVKAEATITTASSINFSFTSSTQSFVAGYTTTRGDGGQVTIQATTTSFSIVQIQNNNNLNTFVLRNFILDCNSESGTSGLATQSFGNTIENIQVKNYSSAKAFDIGQGGSQGIIIRRCLAISGGGTNPVGFDINANLLGTSAIDSWVISQAGGIGWVVNGGFFLRCGAANISGTADGWNIQGNSQGPTTLESCVGANCGRDAIRFLSSAFGNYGFSMQNCIWYGSGNKDVNNTLTAIPAGGIYFEYCFFGITPVNLTAGATCVPLTADPWTNSAGNDLSLNTTAGGGALVRAAGYPGVLQSGGTGYLDGGPLQHPNPGGSSGMLFIPNLEGV